MRKEREKDSRPFRAPAPCRGAAQLTEAYPSTDCGSST